MAGNEPWVPQYQLETEQGRVALAQNCKALQLLEKGECPPHLQKAALQYLINNLCGTYDLEFRPEGERATTFAAGKRYVGLQMVFMLKVNTAALLHGAGANATEQG